MSDGKNYPAETEPTPTPAGPMQTVTQIQLGEVLMNPQWRGHLIAASDNGGDMVFIKIAHPRHGDIDILWPRGVAAALRDWITMALQAPVLAPVKPDAEALN